MPKITFVVYEQCLSSSVTALIDAFSICNSLYKENADNSLEGDLFRMKIAAASLEPVVGNGGVWVKPDTAFECVESSDIILIPPRMYAKLPKDEELSCLIPWLRSCYRKGARIGAMCTGSFVLASTGLLDGKIATTNWLFAKQFRRLFPKVVLKPERILTEDSGLICSGAITAKYHLALHLIEVFGSADLARRCAKILLVDPNRTSQLPYMAQALQKDHGDAQILGTQNWLENNFSKQFSIDEAAVHAGLSPRHFKRRFKRATGENPLRYLQHIRLETAKKLLETTSENIDTITRQVGYEDSRTFRRLFRQYTSLSAREYRERFRCR